MFDQIKRLEELARTESRMLRQIAKERAELEGVVECYKRLQFVDVKLIAEMQQVDEAFETTAQAFEKHIMQLEKVQNTKRLMEKM